MPKLTIGAVAAAAGVNVETIRYYQRRGLLEEPTKPLGEYRSYPTEMVKRIRFIKRAQALGFTLGDVSGLLELNDTDACSKTRDLAAQKLALIEQKISELATMRDALANLVGQCDRKLKRAACPIIEILQWDASVDLSANRSIHRDDPSRKTAFAPSRGIASGHRARPKK
jgi:MerR family mercuric resistance operon transcriptional regulator